MYAIWVDIFDGLHDIFNDVSQQHISNIEITQAHINTILANLDKITVPSGNMDPTPALQAKYDALLGDPLSRESKYYEQFGKSEIDFCGDKSLHFFHTYDDGVLMLHKYFYDEKPFYLYDYQGKMCYTDGTEVAVTAASAP